MDPITTIYEGDAARKESEDFFGKWIEAITLVTEEGIPLVDNSILPDDVSQDFDNDRG